MKSKHFVQFGICLMVFGGCLYSYLEAQNELVHLKMEIPKVAKQIRSLEEKKRKLAYQVELFQNPNHLMELVQRPEYRHLRHAASDEVIQVSEAVLARGC